MFGKECKFVIYVFLFELGMFDLYVVKEFVYYLDGIKVL